MLTASYTSSTRVKKPLKRRRLNDAAAWSDHLIPPTTTPSLSDLHFKSIKPLVCSSCNRSMTAKPGHMSICARCNFATCNICSRMCTAFAPSQPPTPALTYSPTPPITPYPSPRRYALSLNTSNTNSGSGGGAYNQTTPTNTTTTTTTTTTVGKRRQICDDEDDESSSKAHDLYLPACDMDGNIEMTFSSHNFNTSNSGCGRIVCRNCCFENIQSDTTTCFDCYDGTF